MGRFTNNVKVEWIETGKREMMLLEDVSYTDDEGTAWTAHKGEYIDGASIPRFFWRVIGSPFIGHYRRASVIHDVYCNNKSRPHKAVHRVFDEMMKKDGVSSLKRIAMAKAVWYFGPKW